MRSSHLRLLGLIGALLAAGVVALVVRGEPQQTGLVRGPRPTVPGRCLDLPARGAMPSWYPADLPLTLGSYAAARTLPPGETTRRATFAVKGSLQDFVNHVGTVWRRSSWVLGSSEAEPGEAESTFFQPKGGQSIAFIARASFCDAGWTWLYLVLGRAA